MNTIALQIDNIRWNVDDFSAVGEDYEMTCDRLGLPHFVGRMEFPVSQDMTPSEIQSIIMEMLSHQYGYEIITVEIDETS